MSEPTIEMKGDDKMHTRQKETKQYTCEDCERKYAVGDVIVTGSLSREQLRMRNWRREGYCHCGKRFSNVFEDTKNVKWRMKVGSEEPVTVRDRCELPRVSSKGALTEESVQFGEISAKMDEDPEFADSVLATAQRECERLLGSSIEAIRSMADVRLKSICKARDSLRIRKWLALDEPVAIPAEATPKTIEVLSKSAGVATSLSTREVVEVVA